MTDPALLSCFHDQLKVSTKKHSKLELDDRFLRSLTRHFELLTDWNKTHNLIAVEDMQELINDHYLDCLLALDLILPLVEPGQVIYDLGSGNGFPGLIAAIAYPQHRFLLVESNRKKCSFLRTVKTELALSNVTVEQGRVENIQSVNAAITRAAFSDHMISDLGESFASGGHLFLMRVPSPDFSQLIAKGPWAVVDQLNYKLDTGAERCVMVLSKKNSST